MCDSLIALKSATADGVAIFAKNSDRPPNEGQFLQLVPAEKHPTNSRLKCTYIEIPQVPYTNGVLLSKPYWLWGAEMGVNDQSVVIGNEAVFPKVPVEKTAKLLGMDLVRLGLERGKTAREALDVMIALLTEFGQGGNCTTDGDPYYSSFLIADPDDAWVLETAGQRYAVKHVQGFDSISNYLTIGKDYDPTLSSPDLAEYAVQQGWAKSVIDFNFGDAYNDFLYTTLVRGRNRRAVTMAAMASDNGKLTVPDMMGILRKHEPDGGTGTNWQPQNGFMFSMDVCMHGGFGMIRDSNTAGSLVVHLDKKNPTIFVTGSASPCTSLFKPVWMDVLLPDMGPAPSDVYDPKSLFWQHELLHRATIRDFETRAAIYAKQHDEAEAGFVNGSLQLAGASAAKRAKFSADCFAQASALEADWFNRVEQVPAQPEWAWFYNYAWNKFNEQAKMPKV
jgi:dipeptidase